MKIAFICPYPIGEAPSQRFRFEHYLNFLEDNNVKYNIFSFIDIKGWKSLYSKGNALKKAFSVAKGFFGRLLLLTNLNDFDILYIHREAEPIGPPIFIWIAKNILRKKIHFDLDDAIWLRPEGGNRLIEFLKQPKKTIYAFKWCDSVSGGNEYLCSKAREYNKNVYLIPTVVDTHKVHVGNKIHHAKDEIVIGWTGSHSTLVFLRPLVSVLEELSKSIQFTFLIIANKEPDFEIPNSKFIKWNKENEVADLLQMDIGVMPLTNDLWAQGKCGFKAIQYMSLGIPAVVSDVGVNATIVDHGINGFVNNDLNSWSEYLKYLAENPAIRKTFGEKAREKIEREYSVESQKLNFLQMIKTTATVR